jgi:hypothetical protein
MTADHNRRYNVAKSSKTKRAQIRESMIKTYKGKEQEQEE